MTAKDKAADLYEKAYDVYQNDMVIKDIIHLVVDEILNLEKMDVYMDYRFWEEVKSENEKL